MNKSTSVPDVDVVVQLQQAKQLLKMVQDIGLRSWTKKLSDPVVGPALRLIVEQAFRQKPFGYQIEGGIDIPTFGWRGRFLDPVNIIMNIDFQRADENIMQLMPLVARIKGTDEMILRQMWLVPQRGGCLPLDIVADTTTLDSSGYPRIKGRPLSSALNKIGWLKKDDNKENKIIIVTGHFNYRKPTILHLLVVRPPENLEVIT